MNEAAEHITIHVDSQNSDASSEDDVRKELMWEKREENLLKKWLDDMAESSKKQGIAGRRTKKLYAILGVPATLMPIILSGLSSLKVDPIVNSLIMVSTGVLVGVSQFFNLGKKFTEHLEYEGRYDELCKELEKELSKPKSGRVAVDVYMERIYMKYCALNASAPVV